MSVSNSSIVLSQQRLVYETSFSLESRNWEDPRSHDSLWPVVLFSGALGRKQAGLYDRKGSQIFVRVASDILFGNTLRLDTICVLLPIPAVCSVEKTRSETKKEERLTDSCIMPSSGHAPELLNSDNRSHYHNDRIWCEDLSGQRLWGLR